MITGDYQFEIDGYAFGLHQAVSIIDGGFDPGSADWRVQDTDNPVGDGRTFGRDYLGGPSWAWSLFTDQHDDESALLAVKEFATVWRNESGRRTPGEVKALTYQINGRLRRVYGRPRRLAYSPDNMMLGGYLPISATFDCVDALHYDEGESSLVIGTVPFSPGGFPVPAITPWTSVGGVGERTNQIDVAGDALTYPVITFSAGANAVAANPRVTIGDRVYRMAYTIPAGSSVTIDTRPWARTVLTPGGASVAGTLSRDTRLDQASLEPGSHVVSFYCEDLSGQATCTVSWRSAYNSL